MTTAKKILEKITQNRIARSVVPAILFVGICFPVVLYYSIFAFSQIREKSSSLYFEGNNGSFQLEFQSESRPFFSNKRSLFSAGARNWKSSSLGNRFNERFSIDAESSVDCSSTNDETLFFPVVQPESEISDSLTRDESPWGRFQPGSWILIQKIDATYQNGKPQKSIKEIRQTLAKIEDDGYSLKEETKIRMGVVWFDQGSTLNKYDFWGNLVSSDSEIVEPPTLIEQSQTHLDLSSETIPCLVRRVERATPQCKEETTIWFSTVKSPFLLQKETKTFSLVTEQNPVEQLLSYSKMQVQNPSRRFALWNNPHSYCSQTESRNGGGIVSTTTNHQSNIPGGILRSVSTEKDANGRTIFLSNTRVLSYYISPR